MMAFFNSITVVETSFVDDVLCAVCDKSIQYRLLKDEDVEKPLHHSYVMRNNK